MKTYTIDPLNQAKLARALTLRLATTFGAVLIAAVAIALFLLSQTASPNPALSIAVMGAAIVALAVIIGIRLAGQVRDYRRGLASIRIDVGDDRIARRQAGVADITLRRSDVIAMRETDAGVLIMTGDTRKFLWLPAQLGNYAEAKTRLAAWMPIASLPPRPRLKTRLLSAAWGVGTALCLGVLLLAVDPWQVLAAGFATLSIYIFVYRMLRSRREGVDVKFRRTYSGILMFLVLVVVIKLLMTIGPVLTRR